MLNVIGWLENKFAPVPHANQLRGLSVREIEHKLRRELGYTKSGANHFIWKYKARLCG